jgi:5-methylcytosine-specific restriction endonuclease McrA
MHQEWAENLGRMKARREQILTVIRQHGRHPQVKSLRQEFRKLNLEIGLLEAPGDRFRGYVERRARRMEIRRFELAFERERAESDKYTYWLNEGAQSDVHTSKDFYQSQEWREVRYEALVRNGRRCLACGCSDKQLHVDHIRPRSKYPHLALSINNLQVLCVDCNLGKSNKDKTDWRVSNRHMRAL